MKFSGPWLFCRIKWSRSPGLSPAKGAQRREFFQLASADQDSFSAFHPGVGLKLSVVIFPHPEVQFGGIAGAVQENLGSQRLGKTGALGYVAGR